MAGFSGEKSSQPRARASPCRMSARFRPKFSDLRSSLSQLITHEVTPAQDNLVRRRLCDFINEGLKVSLAQLNAFGLLRR